MLKTVAWFIKVGIAAVMKPVLQIINGSRISGGQLWEKGLHGCG